MLFKLIHEDVVKEISFSHDETRLVAACWDMCAHVWALPEGNVVSVLRGHLLYVQGAFFIRGLPDLVVRACMFQRLRISWQATTSADTTVGVWRTSDGEWLKKLSLATPHLATCHVMQPGTRTGFCARR